MPSIIDLLFKKMIDRRVALALAALDDPRDRAWGRSAPDRDRWDADREDLLRQSLEAWRVNPLARRLVDLTSQYVVGGGVGVECARRGPRGRTWW